jgi:hypothetical protein
LAKLSDDRQSYEVFEDRAKIVVSIFEDSANGMGNYSITQRLNKDGIETFGISDGWHDSYVAKILNNRAVLGEFHRSRDPTVLVLQAN